MTYEYIKGVKFVTEHDYIVFDVRLDFLLTGTDLSTHFCMRDLLPRVHSVHVIFRSKIGLCNLSLSVRREVSLATINTGRKSSVVGLGVDKLLAAMALRNSRMLSWKSRS